MVRLRSIIAAVAIATLAANSVAGARDAAPLVGVGSQYDTTHVYVALDGCR